MMAKRPEPGKTRLNMLDSHRNPTPVKTGPRILLVDDHPIARQGVRQMIEHAGDLQVCGEAADADTAMDAVARLHPDLAVVDLSLQGKPGIELIKDLKVRYPDIRILVLSMHDEKMYAERVLRAGARGYIMKQEATEKILIAIRRILAGDIYVSDAISGRLLQQLAAGGNKPLKSSLDLLSDRELEIFQLLGRGKSVREIAGMLHLSSKTVEAHREHIKEKLQLNSSTELLRLAVQLEMQS